MGDAQKYLYGRGAAQDCDHGLRILKPAANAANAKAMIQMGALYSAGLCTPRDLPTAYRSGYAVIAATAALTLIAWIAALVVGGNG